MPRQPIDTAAAEQFAQRARLARSRYSKRHGTIGDDKLSAEVFAATGEFIHRETLRKIHSGKSDPHTVSIESVLALARFYGVKPGDFGPVIRERMDRLRLVLVGGPEGSDTQGALTFLWICDSPEPATVTKIGKRGQRKNTGPGRDHQLRRTA